MMLSFDFDEVSYSLDDEVLASMVTTYKQRIGYTGQSIEYPGLATQSEAIRIVQQTMQKGLIRYRCENQVYAFARAIQKAIG